jgi:hypothetical protein
MQCIIVMKRRPCRDRRLDTVPMLRCKRRLPHQQRPNGARSAALGSGHWALGSGLWALGTGRWALGSRHSPQYAHLRPYHLPKNGMMMMDSTTSICRNDSSHSSWIMAASSSSEDVSEGYETEDDDESRRAECRGKGIVGIWARVQLQRWYQRCAPSMRADRSCDALTRHEDLSCLWECKERRGCNRSRRPWQESKSSGLVGRWRRRSIVGGCCWVYSFPTISRSHFTSSFCHHHHHPSFSWFQ